MREDEEQNKKYEEIIELLLAAGYFRARIKGLSPFDKVMRTIVCVVSAGTNDRKFEHLVTFNKCFVLSNLRNHGSKK